MCLGSGVLGGNASAHSVCRKPSKERASPSFSRHIIALGWDRRPSNTVLTEGGCRIEIAKATPLQPDSRVLPTSNLNDVEMRPQTHVFCSPKPISPEKYTICPSRNVKDPWPKCRGRTSFVCAYWSTTLHDPFCLVGTLLL